jgi:hypothetical protein
MNVQTEILALSLAYAALGVLLLIVVARTRLPWRSKAAAIAVTRTFYVIVFFRLQGLLGWSAHEALPARFELLWAQVVETDLAANEEGAIHLWVEELNNANVPSRIPRAYALPYSAALAGKVEAAKAEIPHGHHQVGRPTDFGVGGGQEVAGNIAPRPGGSPGGDPSGGGILDAKFLGGGAQSIDFAPLPPPVLPPKDAP